MSEINGSPKPWLEMELARQLGPVAAPEALWDRIQNPRPPRRANPPATWALWPVITLTLLVASCVLVWQISHARNTVADLSQLSDRELRNLVASSPGSGLQSADPIEIRNWVKTRCNIDIDLPNGNPAAIRLKGARMIRTQGLTIAAIAYQVAGEPATLLVMRKHSGPGDNHLASKHLFSRVEPASWSMGEQEYAIAWAGNRESQAACQLCHAGARGLRPEPRL